MYILNIACMIKNISQWTQRLYLWKLSLTNWISERKKLLFNEMFERKERNKLIEKKIPDPCNAQKHCQSFIRKKNTKSVKQ